MSNSLQKSSSSHGMERDLKSLENEIPKWNSHAAANGKSHGIRIEGNSNQGSTLARSLNPQKQSISQCFQGGVFNTTLPLLWALFLIMLVGLKYQKKSVFEVHPNLMNCLIILEVLYFQSMTALTWNKGKLGNGCVLLLSWLNFGAGMGGVFILHLLLVPLWLWIVQLVATVLFLFLVAP